MIPFNAEPAQRLRQAQQEHLWAITQEFEVNTGPLGTGERSYAAELTLRVAAADGLDDDVRAEADALVAYHRGVAAERVLRALHTADTSRLETRSESQQFDVLADEIRQATGPKPVIAHGRALEKYARYVHAADLASPGA